MVASWVIGKGCSLPELHAKLVHHGFNVVVVMFSTAVAEHDRVFEFFKTLAEQTKVQEHRVPSYLIVPRPRTSKEQFYQLVNDKAVYHATSRLFVVIHRAKTKTCIYTA